MWESKIKEDVMKSQILAVIPKPKKIKKLQFHERMMLRYSSFVGIGKHSEEAKQ